MFVMDTRGCPKGYQGYDPEVCKGVVLSEVAFENNFY